MQYFYFSTKHDCCCHHINVRSVQWHHNWEEHLKTLVLTCRILSSFCVLCIATVTQLCIILVHNFITVCFRLFVSRDLACKYASCNVFSRLAYVPMLRSVIHYIKLMSVSYNHAQTPPIVVECCAYTFYLWLFYIHEFWLLTELASRSVFYYWMFIKLLHCLQFWPAIRVNRRKNISKAMCSLKYINQTQNLAYFLYLFKYPFNYSFIQFIVSLDDHYRDFTFVFFYQLYIHNNCNSIECIMQNISN